MHSCPGVGVGGVERVSTLFSRNFCLASGFMNGQKIHKKFMFFVFFSRLKEEWHNMKTQISRYLLRNVRNIWKIVDKYLGIININ